MASNVHVAAAYNKGALDGSANIKAACVLGFINIYSGTQPADGDAALSGNTLLAQFTFPNPAFTGPSGTASSDQVLTAGTIANVNGSNTGTATWARITTSTPANVFDCSVGTSGTDIILANTSIVSGQPVSMTSFTVTLSK